MSTTGPAPGGKKTGGRQKGTPNKRTAVVRAALAATLAEMPDMFQGDAHALLQLCYKNTRLPLQLRLQAAIAAIRYEKPALASIDATVDDKRNYVARMPHPEESAEEWLRRYADLKPDEDGDPTVN